MIVEGFFSVCDWEFLFYHVSVLFLFLYQVQVYKYM